MSTMIAGGTVRGAGQVGRGAANQRLRRPTGFVLRPARREEGGRCRWLARVCCCLLAPTATALSADGGPAEDGPKELDVQAAVEPFAGLLKDVQQLDWDEEAKTIHRALDNLWRQNGWNAEADRFAYDVARDTAAIPPWRFMERVNLVSERVASRYDLTPEQLAHAQGLAMGEFGTLALRHAGVMIKQGREVLQTRLEGRPFTPEQVTEWTKETEGMFTEIDEGFQRVNEAFEGMLEPRQRKIFVRDLQSYQRRQSYLVEARKRWIQGKWQASDWGMQDDPIQRGATSQAEPGKPPGLPEPPVVPRWVAHNPSTWYAYVSEFRGRMRLDNGQMTTARSIHAELVERADNYLKAHRTELAEVPVRERAAHVAYAPIRKLFTELGTRLDAITTSGQRQHADQ